MPQALPLRPSVPFDSFDCVLAGVPYGIDVHWNGREGAWYMDIIDAQGDAIRHGIKIVLGAFLGRRCVDPRFPAGLLIAVDTSGENRDAGFDDLGAPSNGGRVHVVFYTFAEAAVLV